MRVFSGMTPRKTIADIRKLRKRVCDIESHVKTREMNSILSHAHLQKDTENVCCRMNITDIDLQTQSIYTVIKHLFLYYKTCHHKEY